MGSFRVRVKMETHMHKTHVYTQKVLAGRRIPRMADSPKDGHNLFYNHLVSAQVENVTTYLCWQDAIPESAINHRGLTALPSAGCAPSASPHPHPDRDPRLPPASLSLCPIISLGFSFHPETHQQFVQQLLWLLWTSCLLSGERQQLHKFRLTKD